MTQAEYLKLSQDLKALTTTVGQLRHVATLLQNHVEELEQRIDALEAANYARAMGDETATPLPRWE